MGLGMTRIDAGEAAAKDKEFQARRNLLVADVLLHAVGLFNEQPRPCPLAPSSLPQTEA